jgi:hypothetical protein
MRGYTAINKMNTDWSYLTLYKVFLKCLKCFKSLKNILLEIFKTQELILNIA